MMATLPGLPMFGHGQIEGFTEKYGMEYQRPRYEENPDPWMVERHDREIAPLLKRRWLFAESYNFLLYDFFHDSGSVDENVFAYSNRVNDQRALVVYNNVYGQTQGTIRISAAYADKGSGHLRQRSLWEGLGLSDTSSILAFRDSLTGLSFLRRSHEVAEGGLRLELHAYQSYVFLDWQELRPSAEKPWDRLCDHLAGRGVPSLDDALINMELRPVHDALRAALDPALIHSLAENAESPAVPGASAQKINIKAQNAAFDRLWDVCVALLAPALNSYVRFQGGRPNYHAVKAEGLAPSFRKMLRDASRLPALEILFPSKWPAGARRTLPTENPQLPATGLWGPVVAWFILQILAQAALDSGVTTSNAETQTALDLFDRLRLREPLAQSFHALGLEGEPGWQAAARIKALLLIQNERARPTTTPAETEGREAPVPGIEGSAVRAEAAAKTPVEEADPVSAPPGSVLLIPPDLWSDADICWLTGAHIAEGHTYLVREPFEELLWWIQLPNLLRLAAMPSPSRADVEAISESIHRAMVALERAGYQLDGILEPQPARAPENELRADPEVPVSVPRTGRIAEPAPEDLRPQEPVAAKPIRPANPEDPPEDHS